MKRYIPLFLLVLFGASAFSQQGVIKGNIKDKETGEGLFGAYVMIGPGEGTQTDFDGNFEFEVDYGTYEVEFSALGYDKQTQTVVVDKPTVSVNIGLLIEIGPEITVSADLAIDRETPVAFSNITTETIEEDLAGQDMPMLLNSTPGVYATNQGGGDGDARITIRGFDQRNIAVMIDGVPVNDMENGWVFWSNWYGLDAVTRTIQVQRGLGASKLAIPSVGGTMNIITKGIKSNSEVKVKQEFGNNNMFRTSVGLTSGRLKGGWGFSAAGSYKTNQGWVNGNYSEMGFWYGRVDKMFGQKHTLSVWAYGAPQSHGQRTGQEVVSMYSKDKAAGLFKGTPEEYVEMVTYNQAYLDFSQGQIDSATFAGRVEGLSIDQAQYEDFYVNGDFIDTTVNGGQFQFDYGFRYNRNAGQLKRLGQADSSVFNSTINKYHKPQINVRHGWQAKENFYLSTTFYVSIGNGGGTFFDGTGNTQIDPGTGTTDYQLFYDANVNRASGESKNFVARGVNSHRWYGLLSTFDWQAKERLKFSGGIDLRTYRGLHYIELFDVFGCQYAIDPDNNNQNISKVQRQIVQGDKYNRDWDGQVLWGGLFGMVEYKNDKISVFGSVSGAINSYRRINRYAKRDLLIDGELFSQIVGYQDTFLYNGTESIFVNPSQTIAQSGDTTFVINSSGSVVNQIIGADVYDNMSPESRAATTDWENIPSFTIKAGLNWNIDERNNVFFNLGFLTKAPAFVFVFDSDPISNRVAQSYNNEIIQAFEAGYSFRSPMVSLNVNGYVTNWVNKPTSFNLSDPLDTEVTERVIIPNIKALHTGIEIDAAIKAHKTVTLEGLLSIGDWQWKSGDEFTYTFASGATDTVTFDATGVHVGDAAQIQVSGMVRYEPIKGLYIKPRITYFAKQFANFDPTSLQGANARRESWRMPNYYVFDIGAGYWKRFQNGLQFSLRMNLFNITDNLYIQDAQNNGGAQPSTPSEFRQEFNANSATVHFTQGFRWTVGIELIFGNWIGNKSKTDQRL